MCVILTKDSRNRKIYCRCLSSIGSKLETEKKITVSFYESVDNTNGKLDYDDVFVSMNVWNVNNKMEAE